MSDETLHHLCHSPTRASWSRPFATDVNILPDPMCHRAATIIAFVWVNYDVKNRLDVESAVALAGQEVKGPSPPGFLYLPRPKTDSDM